MRLERTDRRREVMRVKRNKTQVDTKKRRRKKKRTKGKKKSRPAEVNVA